MADQVVWKHPAGVECRLADRNGREVVPGLYFGQVTMAETVAHWTWLAWAEQASDPAAESAAEPAAWLAEPRCHPEAGQSCGERRMDQYNRHGELARMGSEAGPEPRAALACPEPEPQGPGPVEPTL